MSIEKGEERDKVIFRVDKSDDTVFALFPEIPADNYGHLCQSFTHIGQQVAADLHHCLKISRPAEFSDYKELAEELTQRGYNLIVCKRETPAMREVRQTCVCI